MQQYKSHKVVTAARVVSYEVNPAGGFVLRFNADDPINVSDEYIEKRVPPNTSVTEGYYVLYDNDYESWSPTAVFEAGYLPIIDWVDSTEAARTANNAVRHQYRVLTDDEKAKMLAIKDAAANLINVIEGIGGSPELTIAKRKAQEASMWAVHHVTA